MRKAASSTLTNEFPASLSEAAKSLRDLSKSPRPEDRDEFKRFRIVERVAQLGIVDAQEIGSFIRRYVIPFCCKTGKAHKFLASRYRELLRGWIESLPEGVLQQVRNRVIDDVASRLNRKPKEEALYCLSVLGFRGTSYCHLSRSYNILRLYFTRGNGITCAAGCAGNYSRRFQ